MLSFNPIVDINRMVGWFLLIVNLMVEISYRTHSGWVCKGIFRNGYVRGESLPQSRCGLPFYGPDRRKTECLDCLTLFCDVE